ncbi:MAG: phosphoglycerate kinase [Phycisphaerales bacterium]|nr:phosphoglycerate kinase [Phycisphaerales bacterium]
MRKKSIKDLSCKDQRVLMRVDFNVPLDAQGGVMDDRRIQMALPSIRQVVEGGGRLILMSHLGRPKGTGEEPSFSLKPAADRLADLLGPKHPVTFAGDCVGPESKASVAALQPGGVVVLENLRFHGEEKGNDAGFADSLAAHADIYVNDAFGTAHRDHASMVGVPEHMGDRPRVAGLLMLKELEYLSTAVEEAKSPFYAVLGGAKVSDKIGAIRHLLDRVDVILVGGAMAYTFMKSQGLAVGSSLVEEDMVDMASALLAQANDAGKVIRLPGDHRCAESMDDGEHARSCELGIPPGLMGLDIGPETADEWSREIASAKTVVWNGPLGVFEKPPFDEGTRAVAEGIVKATRHRAVSIVGGGETAAAVEALGLASKFSHVSTGGGASLELLEGKSFRSVELLEEA